MLGRLSLIAAMCCSPFESQRSMAKLPAVVFEVFDEHEISMKTAWPLVSTRSHKLRNVGCSGRRSAPEALTTLSISFQRPSSFIDKRDVIKPEESACLGAPSCFCDCVSCPLI